MCAIKKGILSLFFIICCILNSAAQDFTGFALIKLDFYDDRDPRRTQINRCTLQNGFIIDIALYNNYLVPFNKKDRIHLIKTTDISLPTNIEEAIETKQECRKKYYPRELGQQAPYKEFFEWCLSYRYCSEINPTIEIPLPNNRKHNLCEGDRLPISNYRLDDKNIIMERQILQISEYESNNWKNLDYNYDGNGVSFEDLSTFIDKEFKKSIYNNRFKVRIEYAGYHSNEPDFIYFSQAMPNGTITLTDNHIEIPITPKQSISIAQSITETLYENLERQNNTVTGNLYFGHHTIIIEEDNTCPATYYANIMKATYNYIQDKVDFWSEEHTKRDDAIILHSYSKKNESEKYKPTNPNLKFITSTDSYICALTDEGQNCETEAADSQYYLTGCTYNKKEQQVTITYPEGSNYISQTLHYTLNKYFKNISATPELIQPECADGIGTLVLTDIKGGLNNGYYYTLNRNNTIIEESTISGNSVSINVQNGDRVKIYDNKKKENELFPYTEERAWPDKNENAYVDGYIVSGLSAIQPTISFTTTSAQCYGTNGKLYAAVEPSYQDLSYSWTISNSTYQQPRNGDQIGVDDLPKGDYTINLSIFKIDNNQSECWPTISQNFSIAQPDDITFVTTPINITCTEIKNGKIIFSDVKGGTNNGFTFICTEEKDDKLSEGGETIYDANNKTYTIPDLSNKTYWVTIQDAHQCTVSSTVTIGVNSYGFENTKSRDLTCTEASFGGASVDITVTGNGPFTPTIYKWTIHDDDTPYIETTNSIINTLISGNYTLSVESEQGCTIENTSVTIGVNHYDISTATRDASCLEATNGSASIDIVCKGNGDFTPIYKWAIKDKSTDYIFETSNNQVSNLSPSHYYITIKSGDFCTQTTDLVIDANSYYFDTQTRDVSCNGATNGYISTSIKQLNNTNGIFITEPIYQWTLNGESVGNTNTLNSLSDGTYALTVVSNKENCTLSTTATINTNKFTFTLDTIGASCFDVSNGRAEATLDKDEKYNGLFTPHYLWTIDGVTTEDQPIRKGLKCGNYHLQIAWEAGCHLDTSFTIGHKVLTPHLDIENAPCEVGKISTGVAKLTITNATEPIRYKWDGEETNLSTFSLVPGAHNIEAVDKNGCTISKDFTILSGNFNIETTINSAQCDNKGNGSATFQLLGGSGAFSARWEGYPQFNTNNINGSSYTQDNLPVGIYTVTISDSKGCSFSKDISVSSGDISVSPIYTLASCADVGDAAATISVSNAQGQVEYLWSDGYVSNLSQRNNLKEGNYTITVTDASKCSAIANINVSSKTISADVATIGASCGLDPDGTATAEIFAATYPYTFNWSDNISTTEGFRQMLDKGDYSVTITDSHGCKITSDFHIPHKGYLNNDIPEKITICSNGEAIVDAHEFLDYQWFYNNKTISDERFLTINRAGDYIIKARGYDDCYAVDTVSVDVSQVTFEPYFRMASVSYLDDTLVVVEQSETSPEKYEWHFDKNVFSYEQSETSAHELRLIPNTPGFYNITLSALMQNCTADITKQVEILSESRPDTLLSPLYVEKSVVERFNVSPNPTNSPFNVDIKLKQTADIELRIYDINYGVIRSQVKLYGSETYHHQFTESLPSGMYVVILKVGAEQKMAKIVVSR